MVNPKPKIKFTYEDYRNTPDDKRYELIDGDLIMVPTPRTYHQALSRNLEMLLWAYVKDNQLGEVYDSPIDVVLSNTDVVQPDLIYVSDERSHILTDLNVQGAPNLVVEILSPSTSERDRTLKRTLYARHGVREYWIVDPDAKTVEVLRLGNEGFEPVATYNQNEILTTSMFDGLELNLSEVF